MGGAAHNKHYQSAVSLMLSAPAADDDQAMPFSDRLTRSQRMPKKNVIDLRHDNRIPELLATREEQAAIIKEAKLLKDAAETELRAKLGAADAAVATGWLVEVRTVRRKEFTMPATTYKSVTAKRLPDTPLLTETQK
jgi:hypothetical protein